MTQFSYAAKPMGTFEEKEYGNSFEYEHNDETSEWCKDFPHKIWVGDGYRYGTVKKTVAYVSVDEDEFGQPVLEKWDILRHKECV